MSPGDRIKRGLGSSFLPQVSIHYYKTTPYRYNINKNSVNLLCKHNLKARPQESPSNQTAKPWPFPGKFGASFDLQNYVNVSRWNAPWEAELCLPTFFTPHLTGYAQDLTDNHFPVNTGEINEWMKMNLCSLQLKPEKPKSLPVGCPVSPSPGPIPLGRKRSL